MNDSRRRIRFDLAYDGTDFSGWQVQPHRRTVQGELERVLARIQGERPVRIRGAGRTDAGVHAMGQVADCELNTPLDDEALAYTLRRMLPRDLRPVRVATAEAGFHSRKHATGKTYRYTLDLTPHGDPFLARFALHWPHACDLEVLRDALARLPGRRDWSGFAAAACRVEDRVRNLTAARLEPATRDRADLVFSANGFLQYMVRNLVGTLLEIAGGRMPADRIDEVLATGDRNLAGPTAPARGLCLARVVYAAEEA